MSPEENSEKSQVSEEEALFTKMKTLVEKESEELPHNSSRRGFLQSMIAVALPAAAWTKTAKSMESCSAFENPGGSPCTSPCQTDCEVFCAACLKACQTDCQAPEAGCQIACLVPGAGCQTICLESCQNSGCLVGCEESYLACFPETLFCGYDVGCQGPELMTCGWGGGACQVFGVMV